MIPKSALIVIFVVCGIFAIVGWGAAAEELPNALAWRSAFDCTFSCNSHTMSRFVSAALAAFMFTAVAISSLVLALVQRREGAEVLRSRS